MVVMIFNTKIHDATIGSMMQQSDLMTSHLRELRRVVHAIQLLFYMRPAW
jgi:hypothetical protein